MSADLMRFGFQGRHTLHDDYANETSVFAARCVIRRRTSRGFDRACPPNKHCRRLEELTGEGVACVGGSEGGGGHFLRRLTFW